MCKFSSWLLCSSFISESYVLSKKSVFLRGTLRAVLGSPLKAEASMNFRLRSLTHTPLCMQRLIFVGVSLAGNLKAEPAKLQLCRMNQPWMQNTSSKSPIWKEDKPGRCLQIQQTQSHARQGAQLLSEFQFSLSYNNPDLLLCAPDQLLVHPYTFLLTFKEAKASTSFPKGLCISPQPFPQGHKPLLAKLLLRPPDSQCLIPPCKPKPSFPLSGEFLKPPFLKPFCT